MANQGNNPFANRNSAAGNMEQSQNQLTPKDAEENAPAISGEYVGSGNRNRKPISEDRFIASSAPSTFTFSNGNQLRSPDGIFYATTDQELRELKQAEEVGNLSPYDVKLKRRLTATQVAPDPVTGE